MVEFANVKHHKLIFHNVNCSASKTKYAISSSREGEAWEYTVIKTTIHILIFSTNNTELFGQLKYFRNESEGEGSRQGSFRFEYGKKTRSCMGHI